MAGSASKSLCISSGPWSKFQTLRGKDVSLENQDASAIRNVRRTILTLSSRANSAHAGSALSSVEILYSVFSILKRRHLESDRFIMSKGHAAMALYATAAEFDLLERSALNDYFKDNSTLWGHPAKDSSFPFIHWSTGSLGHGLGAATGFAYEREKIRNSKANLHVCLLSDGECDEGSVWEAALFAGHHKLSTLCAIIDYNKIQSLDWVENVMTLEPFAPKWKAFNWNVIEVDGHSSEEISKHLSEIGNGKYDRPTCLIAHTVKGKGLSEIENTVLSHYRPISAAQLEAFDSNEK